MSMGYMSIGPYLITIQIMGDIISHDNNSYTNYAYVIDIENVKTLDYHNSNIGVSNGGIFDLVFKIGDYVGDRNDTNIDNCMKFNFDRNSVINDIYMNNPIYMPKDFTLFDCDHFNY